MNPLLALRAAEIARGQLREHPGRWGCLAALLLFGPPAVCVLIVVVLLATLAGAGDSSSAAAPNGGAVGDIPADYLVLYREAAQTCPGLDWTILAAIGKIETDHGRSQLPGVHSGQNSAKAGGPMQFLQPTFDSVVARHPPPPSGAHPPSRYNPHDAIYAAAAYLCDSGARDGRDLHAAIFAYNHAEWYVKKVFVQAEKYSCGAVQAPNDAAQIAISFACDQLGLPYVWGGDGPANGDRVSTAQASPKPPMPPRVSTSLAPLRPSSMQGLVFRRRRFKLVTWCFLGPDLGTSPTSVSPCPERRWSTPRTSACLCASMRSPGGAVGVVRPAN